VIARRFTLFGLLFPALILILSVRNSSAQEIVLYASQAPVKAGNWSAVADPTAAGGARLANPDAGAGKVVSALANPSSYAELTFSAVAGIPYRVWVRGKAENDSAYNDSIFVQFSGSLNIAGSADYRIGTTAATEINLEDCKGCGIQGWGWQDNGWGIGILGPTIFFQSTGTQTLRIQTREDGFSIDQIVLSPSTYLYNSPGALKNDGLILPPSSVPAPAPSGESPNNTRIPPGTQIVDSTGAVWTRASSGAILRNGLGTGGAGSQVLYCNRIVYVFGTDSQWYRWTGSGWVAVGTIDPCGGATSTPGAESPNNTRVPPGTQIVDSNGAVWTLSNGAILRNGASTAGAGSQILYCNRIVYVFGTDSQWYRWTGSGWVAIGTIDPCSGTTSNAESPSNTRVPPGTQIVDSNGAIWTLVNGAILRNGASTAGAGSQILYCNRIVYAFGTDSQWYRWTGSGWVAIGTVDPCSGSSPTPTPTPTPTPAPTPPPSTTGTLRVLSWNVAFGKGTDNVQNWDRQAAWIAQFNPDLVGLCEMPSEWTSTLVNLVIQKTGRTWYWHFLPKYTGTNEGNLILSRYSLISTGGRFLSGQRSVAQVTVSASGKTINFFATHLDADSSGTRYTEVGELMSYASNFSESRIVVGDFNAGPDLSETVRMTGSFYDSWPLAMNAGTAVAYPDNAVWMQTRTRRGRIDYVYYSYGSPNLFLTGTQIPDTRDWNNKNVVVFLGTADDSAVRPSDHNPMIAYFDIR
jgi:endonuclease/exonuclease/phosphatase family metal-dependent hydrolase